MLGGGAAEVLVGREVALARVRSFLDQARLGGCSLLVYGEPGVGKTALLDTAAAMATAAGCRVVRAAGVEFETEMPLSALQQLLLPLEDEVAGLEPAHREAVRAALGLGLGTSPDPMVVCLGTLELLRRSAAAGPLILLVDDVPWLDRASAVVVGFLARRLPGSLVSLLATSRTEETGYLDAAGLPELELLPLDEGAAGELLRSRVPGLSSAAHRRIVQESGGNPLALLELPRTVNRTRGPTGRASVPSLPSVGRRLAGMYASRVKDLPPSAQRLLLLVALDGTGDPRVLRDGGEGSDAMKDLAAGEEARLVHVHAATHRLAFRHPLARSAVVELATEPQRREAHRRLAELFADEPDRHAWHLAEAAVGPDEGVAGLVERAARRLRRRGDAFDAVTLLLRASELSESPAAMRRRLAEAAYIDADVAGQLGEAARLLTTSQAAGRGGPPSLQEAVTAAHLLLNEDGDVEAAHRLLASALVAATATGGGDEHETAEALYTLVLVSYFAGRAAPWEQLAEILAGLADPVPATVSLSVRTLGDPARSAEGALDALDAAVAGLAEELDPTWTIRIGLASSLLDRLPRCRSALRRVVAGTGRRGLNATAANAQMLLGRDGFWGGQWHEADEIVNEAVRWCDRRGYRLLAWPGRHVQALLAAARGDHELADRIAGEMLEWATPRHVRAVQCYAWQISTLSSLGRGDYETAYRAASRISPPGTLAPFTPYALLAHMDLVESACRTERHDEAVVHAQAVHDAGVERLSGRLALLARTSAALVATDQRAAERFEAALGAPDVESWPFDLARVKLLYGERLRRVRAVAEARAQLRGAFEIFDRLGAVPWAQRAANELRATGQRRTRARGSGQDALTPQEREIAELAASGLTNKEIGARLFLSHRTVAAHLYRVFPKLGIASRAALRDALGAADPRTPPAE